MIIMTQPMIVVVKAPTATNLKVDSMLTFYIRNFENFFYQKSFGVPSQQRGVNRQVRMTIQTQLDKSRWKVWKMFWKKDPRRTRTTQETPNNVIEMQKDTTCLTVGPAAFSAITM